MNEQKVKNILYTLYVLHTYGKDEKPTKLEFNSFMINSLDTIDTEITNKEQLIERIKNILNYKIENQSFSTNQTIDFNIGDLIKTSFSSSIIHLKFVFSNNDDDIVIIDVFEKGKNLLTINL
tara:strand:+ start:79 stop:444 length:366 start_codon:yes stop_codon:yes gene_type:complete